MKILFGHTYSEKFYIGRAFWGFHMPLSYIIVLFNYYVELKI